MRYRIHAVAVSSLALALASCASPQTTPTSAPSPITPTASTTPSPIAETICPPTPLNVTIDYQMTTDVAGGILISATSNLPNGSDLNASFFNEAAGFLAQDEDTLSDGRVSFGPFSDRGTPLAGAYDFSITFPIATNQSAAVRDCIGQHGELLVGPLVSVEEITGDNVASLNERLVIEP